MRQSADVIGHAVQLLESGRRAEAVLTVSQLAASGDPAALFLLADWKWIGSIVPRNLAQAVDLYRKADLAGHELAGLYYTNLLGSGIAVRRNWPEAMKRLKAEVRKTPVRRQILMLLQGMDLDEEGNPRSVPDGKRLSDTPDVVLYPKLFTRAECDYLKSVAAPRFGPSLIVDEKSGRELQDPIRTSEASTIYWILEDPALHAMNRRLAAVSGTAVEQGEPLQVLRYSPGQQYRPHLDWIAGADNQRLCTMLIYLNDDYAGGETHFCETGLKVRGKTGDALFFRNIEDDSGRPDRMAKHEGTPVLSGTKVIGSRWIRQRGAGPDPT